MRGKMAKVNVKSEFGIQKIHSVTLKIATQEEMKIQSRIFAGKNGKI